MEEIPEDGSSGGRKTLARRRATFAPAGTHLRAFARCNHLLLLRRTVVTDSRVLQNVAGQPVVGGGWPPPNRGELQLCACSSGWSQCSIALQCFSPPPSPQCAAAAAAAGCRSFRNGRPSSKRTSCLRRAVSSRREPNVGEISTLCFPRKSRCQFSWSTRQRSCVSRVPACVGDGCWLVTGRVRLQ